MTDPFLRFAAPIAAQNEHLPGVYTDRAVRAVQGPVPMRHGVFR